jgi:hypothetical protein
MKKNLFKIDSSKFTKDSNKNSIFNYKNEQEKKEDSISFSSETIEEKMNRLIQLKKLEKKNLIQNPLSSETKSKIESSIINITKPVINNKNNNNILTKSLISEPEGKNSEENDQNKIKEIGQNKQKEIFEEFNKNSKSEFSDLSEEQKKSEKININSNIENAISLLNYIFEKNIKDKKLNFFQYLKEEYELKKNLVERTPKKRRTQKMLVKKGTIRDISKKDNIIDDQIEEIEEYSFDEEDEDEDTFIKINNDRNYKVKANQSQLDEYDLFYKEQFFRNELFRYDVENIQDKEEQDITKQMNKLDCKRRLKEKKKLKEVNDLKGLDTTELNQEIKELHIDAKTLI